MIYCAQESQFNSQRLAGFAGFPVLDVAAPWQEAFSGWMQGTRACRSCQVRSEGCSAAKFKPFYSHGKTAPSQPLRLWENLLPPISSEQLEVKCAKDLLCIQLVPCSPQHLRDDTKLGFHFLWHPAGGAPHWKQVRRGRPENQAQGIFGVWYCLEENYPWGVVKNWSPKPGQMGSEERRALYGGDKEAETMNSTEKKKRAEAIRIRGAKGIKTLVNGTFSPGFKSEKWTQDTCILLLVNEVGQWEAKISHDGELL